MNRNSPEYLRDRHLRRVRQLKVFLPLLALAIISSLFLFSRSITLEGVLPIAEVDIADRMREPKMTQVVIATTNADGAVIEITANAVVPLSEDQAKANRADGSITYASGEVTTLASPVVMYNDTTAMAELTGGVEVTSLGYVVNSAAFDVDINAATLDSRSDVVAVGPLGQLNAGRMHAKQTDGGLVLVFNSGVRLIYNPK
jgi:lipopolysaccharide export system protein LptC